MRKSRISKRFATNHAHIADIYLLII